MHDRAQLLISNQAGRMFNFFLLLYPEAYRNQYASEIRLVFSEMYQEELAKNGKVGLGFWFSQGSDMTKSVIEQHISDIGKKGMKKYLQQMLHINKYNIFGGILLLPIFTVFLIDLVARIAQGDLTHYNRPVYALLSHTIFYQFPVQFIWVVLFPLLAVVLSLIPLISNAYRRHFQVVNGIYLKRNLISLLFLAFGIFFIMLIRFHDFAPCMVHGLLKVGFGQFGHIIAVCQKA